jgi:hypothetical protein
MPGIFWRTHHGSVSVALDHIADAINNTAMPPPDAARGIDQAEVNERVDQLLLVCAAMWELLSEKTGVTENDLVAKIAELDARDGIADGKMTYTPIKCPQCSRTIFPKQQRCLYCGAARPLETVFKTI